MVTLLEDTDKVYYKDFVYLDSCGRKWIYARENKAIYGNL